MKPKTKPHTGNFALQWKESTILYLKFSVRGDTVQVHGCLGAAEYINKEMTRQEARDYWKKMTDEGWHEVPYKSCPRDWWFWN